MRSLPAIVLGFALALLPGCVAAYAQITDPSADPGQHLLMVLLTMVGAPAAAAVTGLILTVCKVLAEATPWFLRMCQQLTDAEPWEARFRLQGREYLFVSRAVPGDP